MSMASPYMKAAVAVQVALGCLDIVIAITQEHKALVPFATCRHALPDHALHQRGLPIVCPICLILKQR